MKKLLVVITAFLAAGVAGFIAYLCNFSANSIGKYAGYALFGTMALGYATVLKWEKCPKCNARIKAKSLKCPHCKEELRKWYS